MGPVSRPPLRALGTRAAGERHLRQRLPAQEEGELPGRGSAGVRGHERDSKHGESANEEATDQGDLATSASRLFFQKGAKFSAKCATIAHGLKKDAPFFHPNAPYICVFYCIFITIILKFSFISEKNSANFYFTKFAVIFFTPHTCIPAGRKFSTNQTQPITNRWRCKIAHSRIAQTAKSPTPESPTPKSPKLQNRPFQNCLLHVRPFQNRPNWKNTELPTCLTV